MVPPRARGRKGKTRPAPINRRNFLPLPPQHRRRSPERAEKPQKTRDFFCFLPFRSFKIAPMAINGKKPRAKMRTINFWRKITGFLALAFSALAFSALGFPLFPAFTAQPRNIQPQSIHSQNTPPQQKLPGRPRAQIPPLEEEKPAFPAALPPKNQAAESQTLKKSAEPYRIQLLSPYKKIKKGEPFPIGVFIQLDPGWHSYWSHAGDFGKAPTVKWPVPKGIRITPKPFPRPERHAYSLEAESASRKERSYSFIYKKEFLILFEALVEKSYPSSHVNIPLDMEWFICEEICVSKLSQASLDLEISSDFEDLPGARELFQKWEEQLPKNRKLKSHFKRANSQLLISLFFDKPLKCLDIFPKRAEHFAAQPPVLLSQSENSCLFQAQSSSSRLSGISGLLVYSKGGKPQSAFFQSSEKKPFGLIWFVFMAFLGGLILNVMPCVLPLIFIKFHGVLELSRLSQKRILYLNLSYAAGVILSFLALALFILASKTAGASVGWGFHLQSPLFVSLLALLFVFMGLYLLKWIELPKPKLPASFPLKFKDEKALSHFGAGVLSTTAASPCTVPFMAPALGFAFSRSYIEVFVIFFFLGLGLSFPYLTLSFFPKWLRFVPPPGKWMDTLRSFFSIPLFLTALWLAWLLYLQLDFPLFLLTICAFPLLGLLALCQKQIKSLNLKKTAALGIALSIAILLSAQQAINSSAASKRQAGARKEKPTGPSKHLDWLPFSENHLRADLERGQNVFAAFGAAWCLTCKVNEQIFDSEEVVSFFKEAKIRLYYGDWTSHNPEITDFLDAYSQRGVPFYIFYSESGKATLFPTLLLKGRFLKTLKAAIEER